jgi:hypothetical protein
MKHCKCRFIYGVLLLTLSGGLAQSPKSDSLEKARALWIGRQTQSVVQSLERIAADKKSGSRGDAWLLLGDIFFFL